MENFPFPHSAFSPGPRVPHAPKQGALLPVRALPLFSTQPPITAAKNIIIEPAFPPAFAVQLVE